MGSSIARQVRDARRRARKRGLKANLTSAAWRITLEDFDYRCAYCGGPGSTIDHVLSLARGGGTCIDNCVPSCSLCNERKGSAPPSQLTHVSAERIKQIRRYLQGRKYGKRQPELLSTPLHDLPSAHKARKRATLMFEQYEEPQSTRQELGQGDVITLSQNAEQIMLTMSHTPALQQASSYTIKVPLTKDACLVLARDLLTMALLPPPAPALLDEMDKLYGDFAFTRR
jgi:hypothetical protein